MIIHKGTLGLDMEECKEIKEELSKGKNLYDGFLKVVKERDPSFNIKKIASIQTPVKEIALSFQLMEILKEKKKEK
ncbi:hypothetical protein UT300018_23080 [Clostridium faecium]